MTQPKNSTEKKEVTEKKAYDINSKQKQSNDKKSSDAPDQPLADMNE